MILLDKQAKSPLTHVNPKYKVHIVPAQTIVRKTKSSLRKAVAQFVNSQTNLHQSEFATTFPDLTFVSITIKGIINNRS